MEIMSMKLLLIAKYQEYEKRAGGMEFSEIRPKFQEMPS